jgi:hypothetical protein
MAVKKMRRILLICGVGLSIWQVITLAVSSIAYVRHGDGKAVELSPDQSRLVASLLHPSEADVQHSVEQVEALRRARPAGAKSEPSEVALISALQEGDFDSARRQWSLKRDAVPRAGFDRVAALLENLAQHRKDFDVETSLALALCGVSYRFGGLEAWAWQLWDRAEQPARRARIASVLAVFRDDPESGVLQQAALRFDSAAVDLPSDGYANATILVAQQLAESGQRLEALALYQETERVTHSAPIWGPAVFNQGLLLHRCGYQAASRTALLRLIASSVDDKEPGANLMRTNQNYRYEAANLIADSYKSEGAFPWAYQWRVRAAERYRFYSWCGTCASSASQRLSVLLFRDALLAGPIFVAAHMALHPERTWFFWCVILIAASIVFWWKRRRCRTATQTGPPLCL